MQKGNPKEWDNIVKLMKGTSVWDEVRKTYPELESDSDIADEVLAHYSGRRDAERLREQVRAIADGKGSPLDKADAMNALHKVKAALNKFWKGVADFLGIHFTTAEEVADRVMKDLLDGVDPRKFGENEGIRFQKESDSDEGLLFGDEKLRTLKGDDAIKALDNIFDEKNVVDMPEPISTLDKFKEIFKTPVRSILGEIIKVKESVFNKIVLNNRQKLSGAVRPTIEDADFVIKDTDGSFLYIKRFRSTK